MKTLILTCHTGDGHDSAARAIDYLANAIPCFIRETLITRDGLTVTIEARNEDLATVERVLAPYV